MCVIFTISTLLIHVAIEVLRQRFAPCILGIKDTQWIHKQNVYLLLTKQIL